MKVPSIDTIKSSAIAYLREINAHEEADLLSRCKLEIADKGQQYTGSSVIGLNITLRSIATDLAKFKDQNSSCPFGKPAYFEAIRSGTFQRATMFKIQLVKQVA